MGSDPHDDVFAQFLDRTRDQLARWAQREAKGLLRREDVDDVVAGIHARALSQAKDFVYRTEAEAFVWLKLIARQHVLDRQKYFAALRRQAGEMLRITSGGSDGSTTTPGIQVAGRLTGQVTYAMRRESVELATRAIDGLLPRDQEIVRLTTEGLDLNALAKKLGVTYDAAEQARRRALERFKKAYELLAR